MSTTPTQSTRDLAAQLASRHDRTATRETIFADGAELALIPSLMLANVSQAVDIAMTKRRAYRHKDTSRGMANLARNQEIQRARDALLCECGHKNASHGYPDADRDGSINTGYFSKWPDGSYTGMGACGVDRDTRNHAAGWTGDPCPCGAFRAEGESK